MGLVTLREAASLSQQEVANELAKIGGGRFKCGTAKSVVNRLENGGTSPGYDHMHAYAKVFGIPVGAFFVSTHLVYRLREGDHDGLIQYIEGLEQLISIARQLGKNGPIPDELDQKHAFESLFDGWLEKGVDERQSEERSTPGE